VPGERGGRCDPQAHRSNELLGLAEVNLSTAQVIWPSGPLPRRGRFSHSSLPDALIPCPRGLRCPEPGPTLPSSTGTPLPR
jgi:hypothetical protein